MMFRLVKQATALSSRHVVVLLAVLLCNCACSEPADKVDSAALVPIPQVDTTAFLKIVSDQLNQAAEQVAEKPNSEATNGHYAMVLHAYEQFEPSAALYERAIALSNKPSQWLYLYAHVLTVLGRPLDAASALGKAREFRPADPWINSKYVVMLHMANADNKEQELATLTNLLSEKEELPEFHYALGRLYATNGQLQKAVEHFARSIELAGPFGAAYYASAVAHTRLGNAKEAERLMGLYQRYKDRHAQGSDPYLVKVNQLNLSDLPLIQQAEGLIKSGQLQRAVTNLQLAIERNPNSTAAHISLIGLYSTLGEFDQAEQHYQIAHKLEPERAKLYYNVGLMRLMQHRYFEAEQALRVSLTKDRENADAYVQLAVALRLRGLETEADATLKRALKFDPANRSARLHLSEKLLQQQPQAAIDILDNYYEPSDGGSAHMLLIIAKAYNTLGDKIQAARFAELGIEHAMRWQQDMLVNQFKRQLQLAKQ